MICLAISSYFKRTLASVVVSYLLVLPMVLFGILFYNIFQSQSEFTLVMLAGFFPAGCAVVCVLLLTSISRRLTFPPDVGAEAEEVVDLDEEQREAVGMVIRSDQFPDKLFAPPKRSDLMEDHLNPVYDKEMRSELFGHGTLMLRLVIQLSMGLALLVMAACLYIWPQNAPWYASYVLLFNMLVGPVFSAGSVTNERERQTLELLLTTVLSPWHILSGKLISSLRVAVVLTSFLVWPILLAWLLPPWTYWADTLSVIGYLAIIVVTCLTTTTVGMFFSVLFRKTTVSMMTAYVLLLALFAAPVVTKVLSDLLFPARSALVHYEPSGIVAEDAKVLISGPTGDSVEFPIRRGEVLRDLAARITANTRLGVPAGLDDNERTLLIGTNPNVVARVDVLEGQFDTEIPQGVWIARFGFTSPFAAAFSLPLEISGRDAAQREQAVQRLNWPVYTAPAFLAFWLLVDLVLLGLILWLFNVRWRVAGQG
jgi:ABC-type transport system involved in multi-copper enzyme maturation permease subunit